MLRRRYCAIQKLIYLIYVCIYCVDFQCVATLRLYMTRDNPSSNQWTFRFWVQTGDIVDMTKIKRQALEITATVPISTNVSR
jgi:hypothetical protein